MSKGPTNAQINLWREMHEIHCVICVDYGTEIHHIETGAGGRKNHDRVIPLCFKHHRGAEGIHFIGRKVWCERFGTEQELFDLAMKRVEEHREIVKI